MGEQSLMQFVWEPGQTPIDGDELDGLIPDISLQSELNELETVNIAMAVEWCKRARGVDPLSSHFLRELHYQMFFKVWKWAGKYRLTDKNIGVPKEHIAVRLEQLLGDVTYQVKEKAFPPDELAARFHHRLVSVHPWPNGNGRHARLAADLLLTRVLDRPAFSWGSGSVGPGGAARPQYIAALVAANAHDYSPLFKFVRS